MQPTTTNDDRQRQIEQRAGQKKDPRYVDVQGAATGQRRYIMADERPGLLMAYQTARIPDHIQLTQVNAEGFTATEEAAAEVFAYLEHWDGERQRIGQRGAETPAAANNPVLARERHQVELGNVPQGNSGTSGSVPQQRTDNNEQ